MTYRRFRQLWREWKEVRAAPLVILVDAASVITNSELSGLQIRIRPDGKVSHLRFIMHDNYPEDQVLLQGINFPSDD